MSDATLTPGAVLSPFDQAEALIRRKRLMAFALPTVVLAYLAYIFFSFNIPGVVSGARWDNGATLLSDTWSYKTVVTRENRTGEVVAAIEGERKGTYKNGTTPDWVQRDGDTTVIDLGGGQTATFLPGSKLQFVMPGWGTLNAEVKGGKITTDLTGAAPDWLRLSNTKLAIYSDEGRVTLTRAKTEVFNYFPGWELFFFDMDSPYFGHPPGEIFFGPRIDPTRSNILGAVQDVWNNQVWHHSKVAGAMFETVLMAFLGTFGAALISLPLAFLAAKNFTPLGPLRFAFRRVFDFLRGVDGLIWTILLSRAFGPGPLTGTLAILLTDTGSFGKMFSEALENTDPKQIEGLSSTGARVAHRYRFGVIPQVTPVLLSQVLYFFESNTRSATIIGAITGGGIGLLLTQAMLTQKDWEEVTYYIILVILMVMAMDSFSSWLRRKLIKGA